MSIVTTLLFTYHYSNNLVCRNVNHSDLSNTRIFGISSDNFSFTHPNLPYQFDLEKGTHFGRWKTTWNKGSENMSFRVFFCWRRTFFASTTWTPTSYEWSYNPYKWPKTNGLFLGLKISTYNSGLGRRWGPCQVPPLKTPPVIIRKTWRSTTQPEPTFDPLERPIKFEVPTKNHCLKAGGSVDEFCWKLLAKNCWTFWKIHRRVSTRFFTGEIPKIPLNLLKNGRFQKHVNLHFVSVWLVLVHVGESLSFVWALRIWNPMEIPRTLTSCHGLFSKVM